MTKVAYNGIINQSSEPIVGFYLGQQSDSLGRMIEEMWAWDYQKLEYTHNYIQWLFPLKQKSQFYSNAPILNDRVIQAFRTNELLRINLRRSFEVMLNFYGLQCNDHKADVEVAKAGEYIERKANWIELGNHNYLRITRILTSLSFLGLENYQKAFFKCLAHIYAEDSRNIGSTTYTYWRKAVGIKLD